MITHYEGRGGVHHQVFDSCVIIQIEEINEVTFLKWLHNVQELLSWKFTLLFWAWPGYSGVTTITTTTRTQYTTAGVMISVRRVIGLSNYSGMKWIGLQSIRWSSTALEEGYGLAQNHREVRDNEKDLCCLHLWYRSNLNVNFCVPLRFFGRKCFTKASPP